MSSDFSELDIPAEALVRLLLKHNYISTDAGSNFQSSIQPLSPTAIICLVLTDFVWDTEHVAGSWMQFDLAGGWNNELFRELYDTTMDQFDYDEYYDERHDAEIEFHDKGMR